MIKETLPNNKITSSTINRFPFKMKNELNVKLCVTLNETLGKICMAFVDKLSTVEVHGDNSICD